MKSGGRNTDDNCIWGKKASGVTAAAEAAGASEGSEQEPLIADIFTSENVCC